MNVFVTHDTTRFCSFPPLGEGWDGGSVQMHFFQTKHLRLLRLLARLASADKCLPRQSPSQPSPQRVKEPNHGLLDAVFFQTVVNGSQPLQAIFQLAHISGQRVA